MIQVNFLTWMRPKYTWQIQQGGPKSWLAATEACQSLGARWRLPTKQEALDLAPYVSVRNPKLARFWTSTVKTVTILPTYIPQKHDWLRPISVKSVPISKISFQMVAPTWQRVGSTPPPCDMTPDERKYRVVSMDPYQSLMDLACGGLPPLPKPKIVEVLPYLNSVAETLCVQRNAPKIIDHRSSDGSRFVEVFKRETFEGLALPMCKSGENIVCEYLQATHISKARYLKSVEAGRIACQNSLNSNSCWEVAWAYKMMGDLQNARKALKDTCNPNRPKVCMELARFEIEQGRRMDGLKALESCMVHRECQHLYDELSRHQPGNR